MAETVYIDKSTMDGAFGIIFTQDATVVHTGLEVHTEKEDPILAEISRLCGVHFFPQGQAPEIPLYGVPHLAVFASDGMGGWLAGTEELTDGPAYHISHDRSICLVANHLGELYDWMVSDPDWRRNHLSGGPWPKLPEDAAGRKKLADALHLPCPAPETLQAPSDLPQVFPSREEAEKVFPIQDIWTVLRQNMDPRFQVHLMMSPEDREGRAFVHYTAWQETYTGLMNDRILGAHTLERCRKIAEKCSPDNNFVVLDRENGDRVAGFATISLRARDFVSIPDAGEIIALYVLKEYQGLGLGRMLMEHCLACLPGLRAALLVLEGNEKAIGFYEHMGFRFTGHTLNNESNGGKLTELEMVLERKTANK